MTKDDGLVLVVDDDASIRGALQNLVRSAGLSCETFASSAELFSYAFPESSACLVLDVQLPGGSGLDLPTQLESAGIDIPIIFITGHGTIPMSVRAIKAGAVEFLTKPFSDVELLGAVQQALIRDREARAVRAEQESLDARFAKLTPRERDVFLRVAAGRMNKEIAAELGIVEQTIKQHRGRVMQKLGVTSVADLVRFAERLVPTAERSHPTNVG
jgi:FixJ family two-component response regulator